MKCVSSAWRGDSVWKPSSRSGSTVRIVKHREGAPDSQPRGPVTPGLAAHPAALPTVPVPLKREARPPGSGSREDCSSDTAGPLAVHRGRRAFSDLTGTGASPTGTGTTWDLESGGDRLKS